VNDDALEVLDTEHKQLLGLFDRVTSPDEDRALALKQLMQAWASHVAIEAQILIPLLHGHVTDGNVIAQRLGRDHHGVEQILTRLERRKINSPDVPGMVTALLDLTTRHVSDAEGSLFQALRQSLTADQLTKLGIELTSDRCLREHRHGSAPDSGPVAQLLRKAAERVDHHRDHVEDVGRAAR
jgi:hypothetical protein